MFEIIRMVCSSFFPYSDILNESTFMFELNQHTKV